MYADEIEYLRHRAKQEREIAVTCEDNAIALAHFRMADEYQRRVDALQSARSSNRSESARNLSEPMMR